VDLGYDLAKSQGQLKNKRSVDPDVDSDANLTRRNWNEIIRSTSVTVDNHQQKRLKPDKVDRRCVDNQWLAGVYSATRTDMSRVAGNFEKINGFDNAQDLLMFHTQKLQCSLLSVGKNRQKGVDLMIIAAIRCQVGFSQSRGSGTRRAMRTIYQAVLR
jgi:hypothetical protein